MMNIGIALDIGTSGFRAQAIDLRTGDVISTAITIRHPIPGANVIDHINFAICAGRDQGNKLIIDTLNKLLPLLQVDLSQVDTIAVCGNPFQLSLFQNIEIRDLAYAGKNMLTALGVVSPKRDGECVNAARLGLLGMPNASVIIPPAVSHEIGADALAMLLMTGALEQDEPCIVIDYGTNAEMALVVKGNVYTGSAAAGPALEGQEIEMGMLAAPGAISDVNITSDGWQCSVLDQSFDAEMGDVVEPTTGKLVHQGKMHCQAHGITGTGVVATVACGISSGLIRPPKILTPDKKIHLQDGFFISEDDVAEAGKAIGALRAGFLTLMYENGLWIEDVPLSYMSGASGLYVDAKKAQAIGMVPPGSTRIIQFGNTSLALAKEIVTGKIKLDWLREFAKDLRAKHCMFATSEVFRNIYSIELSLWTYGMPFSAYNEMLDIYKIKHLPPKPVDAINEKRVRRDIPDLGMFGLQILKDIGVELVADFDGCTMCLECVHACPEDALKISEEGEMTRATIRSELCSGTACRRCEICCPRHVFDFKKMEGKKVIT